MNNKADRMELLMTTVVKVNRRTGNFTLYIGRAWAGLPESKWHNPFRVVGDGLAACLLRYEAHVLSRLDLMGALHEIDNQILGCWCHETPSIGGTLLCHGDVLIKLRREQCKVPPKGWWCSRGAGHDGPCAARTTRDVL